MSVSCLGGEQIAQCSRVETARAKGRTRACLRSPTLRPVSHPLATIVLKSTRLEMGDTLYTFGLATNPSSQPIVPERITTPEQWLCVQGLSLLCRQVALSPIPFSVMASVSLPGHHMETASRPS